MLSWNIVEIAALALIAVTLCIALLVWYRRYRNRYPGFGMHIRYYSSRDNKIRIAARLTDSPAGRAGIANGAELLSYNGHSVVGLTAEEWKRLSARILGCEVGTKISCRVLQGGQVLDVEMVAEMIQGPIPDYSDCVVPGDPDGVLHRGIAVCALTGQWIPTASLSDDALDSVLGRH